MNPEQLNLFDAYLSILAAAGISPSLYRFYKKEQLNPIEKSTYTILMWMFLLFIVRVPYQAFHIKSLTGATYTFAIFFAFSIALYFEILLRKHYRLWFKIYLSVGSFVAVIAANLKLLSGHIVNMTIFGAWMLSVQIIIILFCLCRKRNEYSNLENTNITLSMWALMFLAPFYLTDSSTFGLIHIPKLGALGGILFCYATLFDQALTMGRMHVFKNILKSLAASIIITIPFLHFITENEIFIIPRIFILIFGLHLSFRIFMAIQNIDCENDMGRFVNIVNESNMTSVKKFIISLRKYYEKVDFVVLKANDLTTYDISQISNLFERKNRPLFSIEELRITIVDDLEKSNKADLILYEQIIDILEVKNMSHIIKLGATEPYFVLLQFPAVQYQKIIESQATLLSNLALGIERSMSQNKT